MELQYLFRKPTFPMVTNIEGHFIGAKTPKDLIRMDQTGNNQIV